MGINERVYRSQITSYIIYLSFYSTYSRTGLTEYKVSHYWILTLKKKNKRL